MNTRGYLSIGDVLTLLRQEFPDVTISKIRFLESQGLVNPERSPSGYRKFYERDVGRLRWVLQQQREHFLPLKVIRDRLNREGDKVLSEVGAPRPIEEPSDEQSTIAARAVATAPRPATVVTGGLKEARALGERNGEGAPKNSPFGGEDNEAVVEASPAGGRGGRPSGGMATVHTLERPVGTVAAQGQARPAQALASADQPAGAEASGGRERPAGDPAEAEPDPAVEDYGQHPTHGDPFGEEALSAPEGATGPEEHPRGAPEPPPPKRTGGAKGGGRARGAKAEAAAAEEPGEDEAVASGTAMTAEELCRAAGLLPEGLEDLRRFGLLEPVSVAGIPHYDEEALTIAELAVKLADFGIEPRHLRLFRNSVDREVGLIEQVVTPLLRQRNPEARQRAVEVTRELSRLGEGIRGAMLRQEIHRHFGA